MFLRMKTAANRSFLVNKLEKVAVHGCFAYINGGNLGLVWKPEGRARVFLEESYAKESLPFTARKLMQGK